jgi:hypothetical protein
VHRIGVAPDSHVKSSGELIWDPESETGSIMLPRYEIPNHSGQLGFFDWLAPDLVLRGLCGVYLTRKACRVFVHPTLDLTQHVE